MRRVDSLEKTLMLGGIGGRRRRGRQDKMARWHHWLDGRESEWTPGVGDGQGGLACCDSWGRKESDMTERLIWTESSWSHGSQPCLTQRNYEPCRVGSPKMDGSWQNMVHWRREWQTTWVFLLCEPHEQYKKYSIVQAYSAWHPKLLAFLQRFSHISCHNIFI